MENESYLPGVGTSSSFPPLSILGSEKAPAGLANLNYELHRSTMPWAQKKTKFPCWEGKCLLPSLLSQNCLMTVIPVTTSCPLPCVPFAGSLPADVSSGVAPSCLNIQLPRVTCFSLSQCATPIQLCPLICCNVTVLNHPH